MFKFFKGERRGFSVMELLAIVSILAIIAIILVPRFNASSDTLKHNAHVHNKATINAAVEKWYIQKGVWPATNLSDIGADPNYFPDGVPACPIDGSPYLLNAKSHRVQ